MKRTFKLSIIFILFLTAIFTITLKDSAKAATTFSGVSSSWVITKKKYTGIKYGSWVTLVERNAGNKGSITIEFTKTRSNSYSGSLEVTKSVLNSYMGFNVDRTTSVTVSDTHDDLKKNKKYLAQYRKRDKSWKVTQKRKYMDWNTGRIWYDGTRVITVKKQDGFNTRVQAK